MEKFEPESQESTKKETMFAVIQDVIENKYELFDVKTMADYDADFSGDEPLFLNIWTKQEGKGFGYIVFHDFLRRVGKDTTFLSTDFTGPGANMFTKAQEDGLLEKVTETFGLQHLTRWKVVGSPEDNLKKIRDSYS